MGAGSGVFGQAARELWTGITVVGIELRDVPRPKWYDFWFRGGFDEHKPVPTFDAVIGNPPYKFAEKVVRVGMQWLEHGCVQQQLLRLAFLEGQARGRGLYKQYPPEHVGVYSARPSFTGNGKTDATAYASFYWRKGYTGTTTLSWIDVDAGSSQQVALWAA